MLFSIIVPVFNVEHYISNCIESICSQSFSDYELIVVDDGSTDSSALLVKELIKKYKAHNIKLIEKENSGAADTRNIGIENACGKYVIFMDSDDEMAENSLKIMANAIDNDYDLFAFSSYIKKGKGIVKSKLNSISPFELCYNNSVEVIKQYLERTNYIISWQPWAKLFRRDLIIEHNVRFNNQLYSCNDFNFFFKYMLCVKSIRFVNEPVVVYTSQRQGSISTTKAMRRVESNTMAYAIFFNDIKSIDETSKKLLGYASYLFLCALDPCDKLEKQDIIRVKTIIQNNYEVYSYCKMKTAIIKRLLIRIFGIRIGVILYANIRRIGTESLNFEHKSDF